MDGRLTELSSISQRQAVTPGNQLVLTRADKEPGESDDAGTRCVNQRHPRSPAARKRLPVGGADHDLRGLPSHCGP